MLFGALLILIAYLAYSYIVPFGKLSYSYEVGTPHSAITDMRPGEHFDAYQKDDDKTFHHIKKFPVFFHVRAPREFVMLNAEFIYRTSATSTFNFGAQPTAPMSDFVLYPLALSPDMTWHAATTTIDLKKGRYNKKDRRYQFSFESEEGILDISGMKFDFIDK